MIQFLKTFQKQHNLKVKNIRLDNSGENKAFKDNADKENLLKLNWEFTAKDAPQQNGKIERKFATLWGKVRAILNSAKLPWALRDKLWAQCANISTQLENVLISKYMNASPYR
jgi:hypothetical protein